jgi:cytochrome P450
MTSGAAIPRFPAKDGSADCTAGFLRDPLTYFVAAYEQLGPVFRCRLFGRDFVALAGVEANEFIWQHAEVLDYAQSNRGWREQFDGNYLNQLEGLAYNRKRARMNAGFKPSMIMSHTADMSRAFSAVMDGVVGTVADLRPLCVKLVINMTARALLQAKLPPGMDTIMAVANKEALRANTLGAKRYLVYLNPRRNWRRWRIFGYLRQILAERRDTFLDRDDVLSLILKSHPPEAEPLTETELVYDLTQLFMAGSSTTSTLVLWTLLFLAHHPAWRSELEEELRTWDPLGFTSMKPWPKLRATLLEAERLAPPGPFIPRIAKTDFSFAGFDVDRGSRLLHLQTLTHFLPGVYEDPLAFRPSRFLGEAGGPERGAHGTYGGGTHSCLGMPLARVQSPLMVANFMTQYRLEFDPLPPLRSMLDIVAVPVPGKIPVSISRRPPG